MTEISKERFKEIAEYAKRWLFVTDVDDINKALEITHMLLCGEADAVRVNEPYATKTIADLEAAAFAVHMLEDEYNELWEEVYG